RREETARQPTVDVEGDFELTGQARDVFQQFEQLCWPRPVRVRGGAVRGENQVTAVAPAVVNEITAAFGGGALLVGLGAILPGVLLVVSGRQRLSKGEILVVALLVDSPSKKVLHTQLKHRFLERGQAKGRDLGAIFEAALGGLVNRGLVAVNDPYV